MKIHRAYKTELNPNNKQVTMFQKNCGAARFAYNWALDQRIKFYETEKKSTNYIEQSRELTKLKKTDFPWMYEVSANSTQEALRDLDEAFQNFFRRVKQKKGKVGFPKFKSKRNSKQSFRLKGFIYVESNRIKLPRIGWVRLKENDYIPIDAKILSVTVSQQAGRWFCSVLTEQEKDEIQKNTNGDVIGIDFGIKQLATCSNKIVFENPKAYRTHQKKLKRTQKEVSRRKLGGANRQKSKQKLQRIHYKISNIRKDVIHKMTTAVARTKPSVVIIEDLQIKNMLKNRKLSKSLSDASFGEIRRQFEYKSKWYGFDLKIVDKFFPSSKTCSCCGSIKQDLKLSDRIYHCSVCGFELDRDMNAALNLEHAYTASPAGINALGENVRPDDSSKGNLVELGNKLQSMPRCRFV
jgi:putative transposase